MQFYLSTHLAIDGALAILFLIIWTNSHRKAQRICHRQTTPPLYSTIRDIKNLLSPINVPIAELLQARSIPNVRLRRAFQIHNTFVSDSPFIHTHFLQHARRLITVVTNRGWPDFYNLAVQAVSASLPDTVIPFDTFIQIATLRVIVIGLLGVNADAADLKFDDLVFVAQNITELWRLSKIPEPVPDNILHDLNLRLRRLIPDHEEFPNPLEFIIPSWETLWRVVAVAVAHAHNDQRLLEAFRKLRENPTFEQFKEFDEKEDYPSVEFIVEETMRISPPTRHITRAVSCRPQFLGFLPSPLTFLLEPFFVSTEYRVADIEGIQTSHVWNPRPSNFHPMRHAPSRRGPDQEATLLGFGYGPLACIASKWAPVAAGLVAAAVLERADSNQNPGAAYWIEMGERIAKGRAEWHGWSVKRHSNNNGPLQ